MRGVALIVCLVLAGSLPAAAQFGYFGQNKIQYKGFDWRVLRGEHVDLYFYPEEEELSRVTLAYAEESYGVLERRFNHTVARRVPLIIYASHSDFEQTNVLPFLPPEGLLGVTDFLKRRVTLPFRGNYTEFRHTIRHEMVHVFQLSLYAELYARYPRLRRAGLPLWWSEGLAEFFSGGEDSRDEMILRDMTVSGRLPRLQDLTYWAGGIVYPLGGAIHRFLAEIYGEWRAVRMYQDLWKYSSFEDAMRGIYGKRLEDLSEEWQYWLRQHYYPAVASGRPLAITSRVLSELAIKPAAFRLPDDSASQVLYFSPSRGYTDIYAQPLSGGKPRAVVKGERSEQFESFHFFESRLDVSTDGIVAFSSKYFERDALFLWSFERGRVVGRYQFPELVSILSPAWAPDRRSIVFSGLSVSGYSDLYRLWLAGGRLERLTSDRYEDLDPTFSPDGRTIVFASDRTPFGVDGKLNLFKLDVASGAVSYLTYGLWRDEGPRWSRETGLIYFASDRNGTHQVYAVDSTGSGRQLTSTLNGAFDPQWVEQEQGIVFGGFADLSFNIYFTRPETDSGAPAVTLAAGRTPPGWTWPELADPRYTRVDAAPYEKKFTLDFAAGDALVAPGIGAAQGAVFLFSDLLSDHVLFLGVSSFQGAGLGSLLDNFNGTVFYLNQAHRVNWGVGAFRQRGLFFEGDFSTLFEETAFGVFAQLRYPFTRFQRVEAEYRLERSDRFDIAAENISEPHRVAWLASNYLSLVHDNTLWLATGPIDGSRYNLTGGLVNDVSHGRFDAYVGSVDFRKYLRTSLRGAVALRALAYYAGGERPRRINIGGSWGVRGYPRWGYVAGTSAWMLNAEWRFPITDFLSIGFPFGELRFPGVQGALFTDLGRAWTKSTSGRGSLGSTGLGLRMPIGAPLVLRLDLGYRFHSGDLSLYGLPARSRGSRFVDFFFGFNY
ncbi:MAG: PD40 domain-containing protein [Gemmatimonadetes bacterium]|nr:PD40 domain-containing protein [Gemmatimonadota bacterium]